MASEIISMSACVEGVLLEGTLHSVWVGGKRTSANLQILWKTKEEESFTLGRNLSGGALPCHFVPPVLAPTRSSEWLSERMASGQRGSMRLWPWRNVFTRTVFYQ
jgi:hypothetical protein